MFFYALQLVREREYWLFYSMFPMVPGLVSFHSFHPSGFPAFLPGNRS